ncbi:cation:proton antiporter [Bifidobacterium crudilactis]|uniref:Sodium:proton antiporter n=1 Tax=Bifidobacterium crudilactis TaxID=327277 RepID=A0A971CZK7_9BIFI|nr:sodium:proton antiporter [Bifidobacterium crudilactis]MCI1868646.1 sodium:proton antiporter [Bifidobacterium crudilactis]MDN5972223.1 sodium:proton antiporter [Bifidobacterium crudilactis]MDN6000514.1 sodium:proton antiporter [Bifidobacterium crudilactis]MDN6208618.1 sodium:proton antiporter [Bifidobacterium crudilactis]MDN6458189.1 sodium:proton antiporter [Bifidobacterium crudilactis]
MQEFTLILCIVGAVLISSFLSRFLPKISTPLVQILLGIVMTQLPFFPEVHLDPELFMVLFIAPLLYYEAHSIDKSSLIKNLGISLSLAIGLATATMLVVGYALNAVWASIPLAAAFALGAALGPTDAVAVSSLGKEASLSVRQRAILKGESLFNDATGVIGFQFSILAAVTGAFSPVQAIGTFAFSFIGGVLLGLVSGVFLNWLFETSRELGWETTTTRILMEIFFPFLLYIVAEDIAHISGILAVVTAGLLVRFDRSGIGPNVSRTNIVSSSVWTVLSFSLNGAVFVLLGMLLPEAMQTSWSDDSVNNLALIGIIALVSAVVVLIRFIWVSGMLAFTKDAVSHKRRPMTLERWRSAAVMTFGGPKGTITLSLVLTVPYFLASGQPFPMRDELVFVAAGVIIVTLVLANFALPLLAPVGARNIPTKHFETVIDVLRKTVEELSSRVTAENKRAVQIVLSSYNQRIARLKARIGQRDPKEFEALQIEALTWEQDYIERRLAALDASDKSKVSDGTKSENDSDGLAREQHADVSDIRDAADMNDAVVTAEFENRDSQAQSSLVAVKDSSSGNALAASADRDGAPADSMDADLRKEYERRAASRLLDQISRSLSHIDESSEMRWRLRSIRRRSHSLVKRLSGRIRHSTPLMNGDTLFAVTRSLQTDVNRYVIEKLYVELGEERFTTEDVLSLLIEHQRADNALRSRPTMGDTTKTLVSVQEIKREGYAIELGIIQDMLEAGDISRPEARLLRRNVYVMQVDADSGI